MFFRVVMFFLGLAVAVCADERAVLFGRLHQKALAGAAVYATQFPKAMASWRKDGSFDGVEYICTDDAEWDGIRHWDNLNALAWAWAAPQSFNHHSRELGERIVKSIIFWHRVRPWPLQDAHWSEIVVPRRSKDVLILVEPLLRRTPEGQIAMLTPLLDARMESNAEIVFIRGLLTRDWRQMREAANALTADLRVASIGQAGIQKDGGYHWSRNGAAGQLGLVGVPRLESGLSFARLVSGTSFDLNADQMNALRKLALDGIAWVLWNGRMDLHEMGGLFDEAQRASISKSAVACLKLLVEFDVDYRRGYQTVLMGNEPGGENAFVGTRVYWLSDSAVVRQMKYYASLRMTSKRTSLGGEDFYGRMKAWRYFADGTLLLQMSGNEYDDVPSSWKWTRLPGTTLPDIGYGKTPADAAPPATRWTGECDFTGAVSSGLYLAAVYQQNVDGVQALKSYFFAPDAIVCLGAGIASESPYPVATTVEQRFLAGDWLERPGGIWHGRVAYLGNGMLAKTEKATQRSETGEPLNDVSGGTPREMLTIDIPHGTGCRDKSYAYEIRPNVEKERFVGLKTVGQILSNTVELQAVEFADGAVCAVFHKAGRLGDFETDTPCVYILDNNMICLAEPTHRFKTMKISFRGNSYLLTLPDGLEAGSTVRIAIGRQ